METQVKEAQGIVDYAGNMDEKSKNNLLNRLLNNQKQDVSPRTGISSYAKRTEAMQKEAQAEAILAKNLSTASGLKKIAANLANPVRW